MARPVVPLSALRRRLLRDCRRAPELTNGNFFPSTNALQHVHSCSVNTARTCAFSLNIPVRRQACFSVFNMSTPLCFGSVLECASQSANKNGKAEGAGSGGSVNGIDSSFVEVTDGSNHWLPQLAAALQRRGPEFSRIAAAAKGHVTAADPRRLQQEAAAAVARSGWTIPYVAVVVFGAPWSPSSDGLLRWVSTRLANETQDRVLELVSAASECAPQLLRVYDVSSLPHCVLLVKGHVAGELPAGASAARREAFVASVKSASASARAGTPPADISPRSILLDQLAAAVTRTGSRDQSKIKAILQSLIGEGFPAPDASQATQRPSLRVTTPLREGSQRLEIISSRSSNVTMAGGAGRYLLDADERASRLAALGTVALFDTPGVTSEDLKALEEAFSREAAHKRDSAATRKPEGVPQMTAALCEAFQKVVNAQEPQWSADDCPRIRRLPLFNQLTLNTNMFAKAPGAQPPRAAAPEVVGEALLASPLEAPYWQLAAWLARIRRCLAARLFFESSEIAALELAAISHGEWLADAAACNFMQLCLRGEAAGSTADHSEAPSQHTPATAREAKEHEKSAGVHPFDVWFEPRAPSPGRALLSSMCTALGPDDTRVQKCFADFDVLVKADEFYPTTFSHTKARRGGKPRMMRGRSGRWFWLGPYWKPPWAPKRRSFSENWHLTNNTA